MRRLFSIISLHAFMFVLLAFPLSPALGGHFFMITKSENALEGEKRSVTLNSQTTKKHPTYNWSEKVTSLFPSTTPQEKMYFEVTLDLKDFFSNSLPNISSFLSQLPDSAMRVPVLILQNGTSFKFSKIFPGIKAFFEKTPHAQVHYYHSGIQFPCAAQKGLSSLAALRTEIPGLTKQPSPLRQLREQFQNLAVGNTASLAHVSPSTFMEVGFDDKEPAHQKTEKVLTEDPAAMLRNAIQREAFEGKIMALEERWGSLQGGSWPPFGLTEPEQVVRSHVNKLHTLEHGYPTPIVVLEVFGLFEGDSQELVRFCWNTPSLRCVRIQDSACTFSDLERFCRSQEHENKEEEHEERREVDTKNSDFLLNDDRIKFLDVRTGIENRRSPADLPNDLDPFKPYFIWLTSHEGSLFKELSALAQRSHQLFWILAEYCGLLKLNFSSSSTSSPL